MQTLGAEITTRISEAAQTARLHTIPIRTFNHGEQITTSQHKFDVLTGENGRLRTFMAQEGLIARPDEYGVHFAVSRSNTCRTTTGIPFIVTTLGLAHLSKAEKIAILKNIDPDNASGSKAKQLKLGIDAEIPIDQYGMGAGYVGPFYQQVHEQPLMHVLVERALFDDAHAGDGTPTADYISEYSPNVRAIADFALSPEQSLLMPFGDVNYLIREYAEMAGIQNVIIQSPDRSVYGTKEP